MRSLTATQASRGFSDLLDAVERGETVTIMRAGRPVAEIRPTRARAGRELRAALEQVPALDSDIDRDIADALRFATDDPADPWRDA